jgi:predicted dehydrogenase
MIKVGIIGYGYWGPNLARNFSEVRGASLEAICDLRPERLTLAQNRYPGILITNDPKELINSLTVDAIAIATPVSTHYDLSLQSLRAGKHVLVEKPIAASSEQAQHLIDEAVRRKLVLMVDHTFVYTGAVRKIRELIDKADIGELYYYDSVRVNLGLFQHDVNVIWDLAVHDLAIMDFVIEQRPCAVLATGMSHVTGQPQNVAYITLLFNDNFIAHIHVNWLAPVKVRRSLIGGSKRMIVYDDLDGSTPVKVYDKGVGLNNDNLEGVYQMLFSYRWGDMWAPRVDPTEALQTEAFHFVDCIEQGVKPLSDGEAGLRVVKILESATKSMQEHSRVVDL